MPLQLAASLAQPALAALGARHDPLLIKRELRLGQTLIGTLAVFGLLAPQLLPSLAEELTASLSRPQLLGELIATRVPRTAHPRPHRSPCAQPRSPSRSAR